MSVASQKQSVQSADRLLFGEHVQHAQAPPAQYPFGQTLTGQHDLARYLKGMERR